MWFRNCDPCDSLMLLGDLDIQVSSDESTCSHWYGPRCQGSSRGCRQLDCPGAGRSKTDLSDIGFASHGYLGDGILKVLWLTTSTQLTKKQKRHKNWVTFSFSAFSLGWCIQHTVPKILRLTYLKHLVSSTGHNLTIHIWMPRYWSCPWSTGCVRCPESTRFHPITGA